MVIIMNKILSGSEITSFLPEKYSSMPLFCYELTDSTNRVAKDFSAKTPLPFLVVADSQTAGRGRLGRSFYSPASSGIYMSLTVGGFDALSDAVFVTSAAAVAVTDAIIKLVDKTPQIKWVNDVYLDGKKVCGILVESVPTDAGFAAVVGIGVNMTTADFPEDISDIAGSVKTDVPREKMIAEITANLLEICKNPDDKSFLEKYKSRSMLLGREITYKEGDTVSLATAIDIDYSGGLVIRDSSGNVRTLSSGDVTVRLK